MADDLDITVLLQRFADGDKGALDQLMPLVYAELRRLARRHLSKERSSHTLQATALVHEAYALLLKQSQPDYRNRSHFLGVAAHLMREILIDHARARRAAKRGGGVANISLESAGEIPANDPTLVIAIDEALVTLERKDAQKAKLVEMRFFGGMTAEESAEALGMAVGDVRRHLRMAQAWLKLELSRNAGT